MLWKVRLVVFAKCCAFFGDFVFCLVDELFEYLFDSVISYGSGLLKCVVGADEGVGLVGS